MPGFGKMGARGGFGSLGVLGGVGKSALIIPDGTGNTAYMLIPQADGSALALRWQRNINTGTKSGDTGDAGSLLANTSPRWRITGRYFVASVSWTIGSPLTTITEDNGNNDFAFFDNTPVSGAGHQLWYGGYHQGEYLDSVNGLTPDLTVSQSVKLPFSLDYSTHLTTYDSLRTINLRTITTINADGSYTQVLNPSSVSSFNPYYANGLDVWTGFTDEFSNDGGSNFISAPADAATSFNPTNAPNVIVWDRAMGWKGTFTSTGVVTDPNFTAPAQFNRTFGQAGKSKTYLPFAGTIGASPSYSKTYSFSKIASQQAWPFSYNPATQGLDLIQCQPTAAIAISGGNTLAITTSSSQAVGAIFNLQGGTPGSRYALNFTWSGNGFNIGIGQYSDGTNLTNGAIPGTTSSAKIALQSNRATFVWPTGARDLVLNVYNNSGTAGLVTSITAITATAAPLGPIVYNYDAATNGLAPWVTDSGGALSISNGQLVIPAAGVQGKYHVPITGLTPGSIYSLEWSGAAGGLNTIYVTNSTVSTASPLGSEQSVQGTVLPARNPFEFVAPVSGNIYVMIVANVASAQETLTGFKVRGPN
jgi:hypothetical protein